MKIEREKNILLVSHIREYLDTICTDKFVGLVKGQVGVN
jgi:ABC-type polysaccharide/polyol phosphate transport system ATPase subunit